MRIIIFFIFIVITSCFKKNVCEDNPKAKDGINITYDSLNKPIWIYELKKCYLNGISIKFHSNGNIKQYGYGVMGKREGWWNLFDSSGKYHSKQFFEKDKLIYVFDDKEFAKFYLSAYRFEYKNKTRSFAHDSLIIKSHYSDFFVKYITADSIILSSEKKEVIMNGNLDIIN